MAWLTWDACGGWAEEQLGTDFVVAPAISDQGEYLAFAFGEHRESVLRGLGGCAVCGELADEASGDPRRE
jgi:hypothetical protein